MPAPMPRARTRSRNHPQRDGEIGADTVPEPEPQPQSLPQSLPLPRPLRGFSAGSSAMRKAGVALGALCGAGLLLLVLLLVWASGRQGGTDLQQAAAQAELPRWETTRTIRNGVVYIRPAVLARYRHDPHAFLQGLEFDERSLASATATSPGHVWESTGLYGESKLRLWDLATGETLQEVQLDDSLFGEGLTVSTDANEVVQLTWREHAVIVYDRDTLEEKRRHQITMEGWGIVRVGDHFIVADGSADLIFFDAKTFEEVDRVRVKLHGTDVRHLNELEFVEGRLWVNVWFEKVLLVVNPESGEVEQVVDLRHVVEMTLENPDDHNAVLNGIAFDRMNRRMFVSGKLWPYIYQIDMT